MGPSVSREPADITAFCCGTNCGARLSRVRRGECAAGTAAPQSTDVTDEGKHPAADSCRSAAAGEAGCRPSASTMFEDLSAGAGSIRPGPGVRYVGENLRAFHVPPAEQPICCNLDLHCTYQTVSGAPSSVKKLTPILFSRLTSGLYYDWHRETPDRRRRTAVCPPPTRSGAIRAAPQRGRWYGGTCRQISRHHQEWMPTRSRAEPVRPGSRLPNISGKEERA